MALKIYLIRHGKTQWNLERRIQGSTDIELAQEGIDDAKKVGQVLAHIPFKACYSSMLTRTHQTAQHIIGERKIPHFHHKGLNEFGFGLWEGVKSDDLQENQEYQLLRSQPKFYTATESQGEQMIDFKERVMRAFNDIVELHQAEQEVNILIVAHGMTLTLLTAIIKGLPWYEFRNTELHQFVDNTSVNIIEVTGKKAELVVFNQAI
ncbi:Alpha-ribazole phosphatase [Phocoenobacter uteri]|uniref:phosphoglycerate mutase (2,3-diphosphoglycerate-dependent) n=1 Tax=Phocoenobacter uteri TaxID=146806 RepID=A0A379C847_9PAST|nr:histidine phosphatase family protein [Phocoenobacter uteri]MDG6882227.1 phosphoglycerate mutase [Phocoenobacter uteri]SUB58381.1 Alpha-ribazole phosphatase [Phocoenobacter uteri]